MREPVQERVKDPPRNLYRNFQMVMLFTVAKNCSLSFLRVVNDHGYTGKNG